MLFFLLINVKMQISVVLLTFMSGKNFHAYFLLLDQHVIVTYWKTNSPGSVSIQLKFQ